jgi:hypothetical protein
MPDAKAHSVWVMNGAVQHVVLQLVSKGYLSLMHMHM